MMEDPIITLLKKTGQPPPRCGVCGKMHWGTGSCVGKGRRAPAAPDVFDRDLDRLDANNYLEDARPLKSTIRRSKATGW